MAYPNGVSLAVIEAGRAGTFFGDDASLTATVTPVLSGTKYIVHAASGFVMVPASQVFTAAQGGTLSFSVPHTNQAGWQDGAGNAFTGWAYKVDITVTIGNGRSSKKHTWTKNLQPVVGQDLIDLDLVADGNVGVAVSAPLPEILSVNGQTGHVIVDAAADDGQIASLLQNPASSTGIALDTQTAALLSDSTTAAGTAFTSYVDETANATRASVIDPLTTALDTRDPRPLVVAQASDSTGDSAAEWFELSWKELLASKWPDRPAQVYRWVKSSETYTGPGSWQTASTPGSSGPVTLARDTFSTDRSPVNGTPDESGHTWAVTGPALAVSGGYLRQTAAGLSYASITLENHNGIDGTSSVGFKIASTGSTQQLYLVHSSSTVGGGNRLQVVIGGTGGATPTLQQVVGGTTTTLATWPATFLSWSAAELTVNASITVSGTSVSATINGTTLTATVDPAAIGKAVTYLGFNNAQGIQVDSFEKTGTVTAAASPSSLGYFTAYNAGYAGGRAEHQLARLDTMFPVRPDVLFINHGHNYLDTVTPEAFETALMEFVDAFHAKYPGVPVVAMSQNPEFPGGMKNQAQVDTHHARQRHLRAMCKRRGWGYIPSMEAFMSRADSGKSLIDPDGVHPIIGEQAGTGTRLQADVAKAWISSQSLRP